MTLLHDDTILVTGAAGLVGLNLCRYLLSEGFTNVVPLESAHCNLVDWQETKAFFAQHQPKYVFHMAGRVRGLMGNMKQQGPAYYDNVQINTHVIEAARLAGCQKIVAMGTVAMYPHPLPGNPLTEAMIWMGAPHESEYGYAQAKRGMLAQLEAYHDNYDWPYVMALATNLYGPHDRFNVETGHVIPSLVRKFFEAAQSGGDVTIWGDGSPQRDFLYVQDAVRALVLLMEQGDGLVNLVTGTTNRIRDVVSILAKRTGIEDRVHWDTTKPNGQVIRAYDDSKLKALGFRTTFDLQKGLEATYEWYAANYESARRN